MNSACFLLIAFLSRLCQAVLLCTRECTDCLNALDIQRVDAFYDQDNTHLVYYALRVAPTDPGYKITSLNRTTNSYSTFHVEVAYQNGTVQNWYYSFCDFTSRNPYVSNLSEPVDFTALASYNEYHNITSVCPIYNETGDIFYLNYVQYLGVLPDLTSYHISFSVISNDGTNQVLTSVSSSVTPQFDRRFSVSVITVFSVILFVMIIIDLLASFLSPFNESKYDCFLSFVSAICNAPFLNHMNTISFDYLEYLQFAFFNGGLNVLYPGFYKPVLMYFNWSSLMTYDLFSSINTYNVQDVDHLYANGFADGLSGLTDFKPRHFRQFGWRVFIIWSLFVVAIVLGIGILTIVVCWLYHMNRKSQPFKSFLNGFWRKSFYYLLGKVLSVYYALFALPFLVLSLYQFSIYVNHNLEANSATSIIGFILTLIWFFFLFGFLAKYIILNDNVRSRVKYLKNLNNNHFNSKNLYVSVKVINLFGFMYYKYRPNRTSFVFYSYSLLFIQAIVISCIQKSGTVQVFLIIAIQLFHLFLLFSMHPHYFEPKNHRNNNSNKHKNKNPILPRNMPFYSDILVSIFKSIIVLLNIGYIPAINASERARSFIGYIQLCLHIVVIAFFVCHSLALLLDLLISIKNSSSKFKPMRSSNSDVKHTKLLSQSVSSRKLMQDSDAEKVEHNDTDEGNTDTKGLINLQSPSDLYFRNATSAYSPQFDSNIDNSGSFYQNTELENDDTIAATDIANELSYTGLPTEEMLESTASDTDEIPMNRHIIADNGDRQLLSSHIPFLSPTISRGTEYYSIREADLYRNSILNEIDDYDANNVINPDSEIKNIWNRRAESANPMKAENYLEDSTEDSFEDDTGLNLGKFLQKMKWKKTTGFSNGSIGHLHNIKFSDLNRKSHDTKVSDYSLNGSESIVSSSKSNGSSFQVSRPKKLVVRTVDEMTDNKSQQQLHKQKSDLGKISEDVNDSEMNEASKPN